MANNSSIEYYRRLVRYINDAPGLNDADRASMLGLAEKIGVYDPLTGLLNKAQLEDRLLEEFIRAKRHKTALSAIMFDIDNFKLYNDSYGEKQGDVAIAHIGRVLNRRLKEGRAGDILGRYGGEEFLMVLPHTDEEGAIQVADGICRLVSSARVDNYIGMEENRAKSYNGERSFRDLSLSAGVATFSSSVESHEQLANNANFAMRKAKDSNKGSHLVYIPNIIPPNPSS